MKEKLTLFLAKWWVLLVFIAILPVYYVIAVNNERNVDYVNNGFFTFWLSGHMAWTHENPYSTEAWVGGHHANGATWIPNKIFPYPLPLQLFTAPLGLMSMKYAYIAWDFLAQILVAGCILWLALRWEGLNRQGYAIFVLLATILNGNIFLGLMTGTITALFLAFLTLSLFFMEKDQPFWAGVCLAGLALKPPLLTVVAMIGIWLLVQRNWKMIIGIATGGLGLLLTGLVMDPGWLQKFGGAGENLFNMRLGSQPTIISYTRLACQGNMGCAFGAYVLIVLVLIGVFTWLMWKKGRTLSPLMAFSVAITLGVLLPPYIWSYDYGLLIIPICYISFDLIRRRATYLYSTLFLLALDVLSLIGLTLFWINPESNALTIQRDMWSIWVATLVLAITWWMIFQPAKEKQVVPKSTI